LLKQYYFKRPRAVLLLAIWLFLTLGGLLVALEPGFICERIAEGKIRNCQAPSAWWERGLLLIGSVGVAILSISRVIMLRQTAPALQLDDSGISGISPFGNAWFTPWTALTKIRQMPFSILFLETGATVTPTRWMRMRNGRYTFAIVVADINTSSDEIVRIIRTKRNDL